MRVNVYWNKRTGSVLVPTLAKTQAGFWLEIEPVEQAEAGSSASVSAAVKKSAARAGTIVSTPTRASFPKPVVLQYSAAKSWSAFRKNHELLSVERSADGRYLVRLHTKSGDGGYDDDPGGKKELALGSGIDDAVATLISLMG